MQVAYAADRCSYMLARWSGPTPTMLIPLLQRSDIISPLIVCVAGLGQSIAEVPVAIIQVLGYTVTVHRQQRDNQAKPPQTLWPQGCRGRKLQAQSMPCWQKPCAARRTQVQNGPCRGEESKIGDHWPETDACAAACLRACTSMSCK